MSTKTRCACIAAALLLLAAGAADARDGARGPWRAQHFHHRHHGAFWGAGLGLGFVWPCCLVESRPWPPAEPIVLAPPVPVAPAAPDPVFVAERGQDARQTESDRRACDRETMHLPEAMADARVFHARALDCMRARGYALR